MKNSEVGTFGWIPFAAILCAGAVAHGLVVFTDYRLWDGWEFSLWLTDPEQTRFLFRLFDESGRPLDGLFFRPFIGLGNPHIAAKAVGVSAWLGHALLMYECGRRVWLLGPALALAVAMLVVTCPVFRPLGELTFWMYTCEAMLFWLAAYLFVRMAEVQEKRWRLGLRVTGLAVLFLSLNLNSLLVFFYGLAAALVLRRAWQHGLRPAVSEAVGIALRYPDILLLPIVFWCWKSWFTPAYGPYINYNRPSLDLLMWARGYLVLVTHFLCPFVVEPFTRPGVLAASGLFAAIIVMRMRARLTSEALVGFRSLSVGPAVCAAAGMLLLFAAAFPYICVGHVLADEPWLARNNILTPLPMALLVVSAAIWLTAKLVPSRPFAWFGACLVICGLWAASCITGYLRLQAFGVKQLAIRAHVRELIRERHPAVIQFRDYVAVHGGIAYYPPLIWTAMAACCDQVPRTLIFDSRIAVPDQQARAADGTMQVAMGTLPLSSGDVTRIIDDTTTAYALTEIPRHGGQFLLAALPSATMANPEQVAIEYLRRRWAAPAAIDDWVKTRIEVKVIELEPIRTDAAAR